MTLRRHLGHLHDKKSANVECIHEAHRGALGVNPDLLTYPAVEVSGFGAATA